MTDEHKEKAKEMRKEYVEQRPTVIMPGSGGTVAGTAVNEWLDDDGNPKFGDESESEGDKSTATTSGQTGTDRDNQTATIQTAQLDDDKSYGDTVEDDKARNETYGRRTTRHRTTSRRTARAGRRGEERRGNRTTTTRRRTTRHRTTSDKRRGEEGRGKERRAKATRQTRRRRPGRRGKERRLGGRNGLCRPA